jgi:lactoylglutathione lyase
MKFGYTIFYVADVAATVEFYEKCFGLKRRFVHESGQYAEMETGATALAFAAETLVQGSGIAFVPNVRSGKPAGIEVGLVSDDPKRAYAHAIANGALGIKPVEAKPWGQLVGYVRDLNGCLVEICSAVG